ncbi:DUF2269 domain-containing protein [Pseudomonas cavernae]|uniref:DUF2269 domain-containing protein n=1 Tax=Pseudomonas cavernae TaxID=2320867 RepID=A0A385Z0A7_9PSED|nr:DUF2269 domain-containing protein [Pseudomonas cavernae]AYC31273.1 DUF2269 domain-containing protein [Pseudomonas cavernae]
MSSYLILKYLHVLGATLLIGTGAGIAFFMLLASRSGNRHLIVGTARLVVIADWVFTAPAVVLQFASGMLLMEVTGYRYDSPWFMATLGLFVFIGCCWLPVVVIQYRLRAHAGVDSQGDDFQRLMKRWIALGIPAFAAILVLLWLMIAKPLPVV